MVDIIGEKKKNIGAFRRIEGYSLQTGKAIGYELIGYPFRIEATRHGVSFQGSFPLVRREGILAIQNVLIRAVRHHEHLASFPEGQKQTALPEEILEAEEMSDSPLPDPAASRRTIA